MKKQFALRDEAYQEAIFDQKFHQNVFFLAQNGFSVNSDTRELALKVVDFLNTLPEIVPYPMNQSENKEELEKIQKNWK